MNKNLIGVGIKPQNKEECAAILSLFKNGGCDYPSRDWSPDNTEYYYGVNKYNDKGLGGWWKEFFNETYESFADFQKSLECPPTQEVARKTLPPAFQIKTHNEGLSALIQQRFFDNGFYWPCNYRDVKEEKLVIHFNFFGDNNLGYSDEIYKPEKCPIVTLDEFFTLPFHKPEKVFDFVGWSVSEQASPGSSSLVFTKGGEKYSVLIESIQEIGRAIDKSGKPQFPVEFWIKTPHNLIAEFVVNKLSLIFPNGRYNGSFDGYPTIYVNNGKFWPCNSANFNGISPEYSINELFAAPKPTEIQVCGYTATVGAEETKCGCITAPNARILEMMIFFGILGE